MKAALTGHLVLSTLHTNDAPSTISRLMNMGIEPFLVATSVNLICAQRLVRRICQNCKVELEVPEQALIDAGYTPEEAKKTKIYHGKGCNTCNKGGYKGRTGLYEVMEINDELRELILVGASALELKKESRRAGNDHVKAQRIDQGSVGPDDDGRSGTRNRSVGEKVSYGWNDIKRIAEKDDRDGRQRPAHHHQ